MGRLSYLCADTNGCIENAVSVSWGTVLFKSSASENATCASAFSLLPAPLSLGALRWGASRVMDMREQPFAGSGEEASGEKEQRAAWLTRSSWASCGAVNLPLREPQWSCQTSPPPRREWEVNFESQITAGRALPGGVGKKKKKTLRILGQNLSVRVRSVQTFQWSGSRSETSPWKVGVTGQAEVTLLIICVSVLVLICGSDVCSSCIYPLSSTLRFQRKSKVSFSVWSSRRPSERLVASVTTWKRSNMFKKILLMS